jgi:serine/threonine protein kinase
VKGQNSFSDYQLDGKFLGKGAFAVVRKALHKPSGKVFACKTYNRLKIVKPLDIKNLSNEIEILEQLDHPSIIALYEKYNQTRNIHLIMELGGDQNLKDFLKSRKEGWITVEGRLWSPRGENALSPNRRRCLVPAQE